MQWYTLAIIYNDYDEGTMIYRRKNMTADEVWSFRQELFARGLYVTNPEHPATEGVIIPPWEIKKISCFMQLKKWE